MPNTTIITKPINFIDSYPMYRFFSKQLDLYIILWLASSIIVFIIGWCKTFIGYPLAIGIIWCIYSFYKECKRTSSEILIKKSVFWLSVITIVILMAWCGIGGYVVQPNDHFGRNAIFKAIVEYSWPVYDDTTKSFECYYLAFWMIPALIGKLFNSVEVGYLSQLIWISIGMTLLYLEICRFVGQCRYSILWMFYLFAGIKIISILLVSLIDPIQGSSSIATWISCLFTNSSPGTFHAGPIVQLLYDPFNQTIPIFLGMALILLNSNSKNLAFIYSLLLLYGPFPFIGMFPIIILLYIRAIKSKYSFNKFLTTRIFTINNLISLAIMFVVGFYFLANINGSNKGFKPINNISITIIEFAIYLIFEFGVYIWGGYKACDDKTLLWITFFSVCIFAWYQIGLHNDFCFRSNMPLIFYLSLIVIKRFYLKNTSKITKWCIIGCLLIGGVPAQIHPLMRLASSYCILTNTDQEVFNSYQNVIDVKSLYIMQQTKLRNEELDIFHCGEWDWMCKSFRGNPNSIFYKYISKK